MVRILIPILACLFLPSALYIAYSLRKRTDWPEWLVDGPWLRLLFAGIILATLYVYGLNYFP